MTPNTTFIVCTFQPFFSFIIFPQSKQHTHSLKFHDVVDPLLHVRHLFYRQIFAAWNYVEARDDLVGSLTTMG